MKNKGRINESWKLWVITKIDHITTNLYHEDYKVELNSIRNKYIFKDISEEMFLNDIKNLRIIEEACEYKTSFFYEL